MIKREMKWKMSGSRRSEGEESDDRRKGKGRRDMVKNQWQLVWQWRERCVIARKGAGRMKS